jgi:diguanylate cyclase (GGDEF)-like protein
MCPDPERDSQNDVDAVSIGEGRDQTAEDRDRRAAAHDDASESRDRRANERDSQAEARAQTRQRIDPEAAGDRAAAVRDRRASAADRAASAQDRESASTDRAVSADDRLASSIDALTGAHRRDAGFIELKREVARALRTEQLYVLAYVDVDGFKEVNDSRGHAAGDALLRDVADAIRARFRTYDLLIRFGGDEFVCGLPDMTTENASERLAAANANLGAREISISYGVGTLSPSDGLADLIERADRDMYAGREARRLNGT